MKGRGQAPYGRALGVFLSEISQRPVMMAMQGEEKRSLPNNF
jgi:hypothetical protein